MKVSINYEVEVPDSYIINQYNKQEFLVYLQAIKDGMPVDEAKEIYQEIKSVKDIDSDELISLLYESDVINNALDDMNANTITVSIK